jgi:protein SCO1
VILFSFLALALVSSSSITGAHAAAIPDELKGIGITEKLGSTVDIQNLTFRNEAGESVVLADYFKSHRPVLLTLVYYECPSLCGFVLNGVKDSLKKFAWNPGEQFEMVTVSINPKETPELASAKKESYLKAYGRPGAEKGWHFLTGEESMVQKLAAQVGFGYRWVPKEKQYAHGAGMFVLTPEGKVSRVLYGIEYHERDLKLALVEASSGKVGTIIDRIILFCYQYNPATKKYSVYLSRVMQTGCAGTVMVFGAYLGVFWRRQRKISQVQGS